MLSSLSPHLEVSTTAVRCSNPGAPSYEQDARHRDLVFVPTLFTTRVSYPFSPSESPYVLYPAVGIGNLSNRSASESACLRNLLGANRTRALRSASDAISSSDLARLGLDGASEHLVGAKPTIG
jgi:hypothetical protein